MGNCCEKSGYAFINGSDVYLSPLMLKIRDADINLFHELLPYYDESNGEIKINLCLDDNSAPKFVKHDALKNDTTYYFYTFKIHRANMYRSCESKTKTKYGFDDIDKNISGPLTWSYFGADCLGNCEIKHKFLKLLENGQNIDECKILFKLLCYIKGIDYTQHLNNAHINNVRTNTVKIGEPDEPTVPH